MYSVSQGEDINPEQAHHEEPFEEAPGCLVGHQAKQAKSGTHQPYRITRHSEELDRHDHCRENG